MRYTDIVRHNQISNFLSCKVLATHQGSSSLALDKLAEEHKIELSIVIREAIYSFKLSDLIDDVTVCISIIILVQQEINSKRNRHSIQALLSTSVIMNMMRDVKGSR